MYLTAVLATFGYAFELEKYEKKSVFIFNDVDSEFNAIIDDFFAKKLSIEPNALFTELKNIKQRLYA